MGAMGGAPGAPWGIDFQLFLVSFWGLSGGVPGRHPRGSPSLLSAVAGGIVIFRTELLSF